MVHIPFPLCLLDWGHYQADVMSSDPGMSLCRQTCPTPVSHGFSRCFFSPVSDELHFEIVTCCAGVLTKHKEAPVGLFHWAKPCCADLHFNHQFKLEMEQPTSGVVPHWAAALR